MFSVWGSYCRRQSELFAVCFFFADGKVYFTVSFSLPSIDDGKPFLCRLARRKADGKAAY
jgi:hypothetical protein